MTWNWLWSNNSVAYLKKKKKKEIGEKKKGEEAVVGKSLCHMVFDVFTLKSFLLMNNKNNAVTTTFMPKNEIG